MITVMIIGGPDVQLGIMPVRVEAAIDVHNTVVPAVLTRSIEVSAARMA
jgi:hypothetical protein